jgi:DNA-binding LytR/AlgR family response regulator
MSEAMNTVSYSRNDYTAGGEDMRKIRIVVCDDNKAELNVYARLCRKVSEKHHIDIEIKAYSSGNDLLFDLEDPKFFNTLDLLFLDITMPGINGVETARYARKLGYTGLIIFITASDEHYVDAFDVGAFHYISKGENSKRFEEIFIKALELSKEIHQEQILLSGWGELKQVKIRDIYYFEVVKGTMTVFYDDGSFEFNGTLDKLEERLKDCGFQRIHRNYLVSLTYVKSITYTETIMANDVALPVGRTHYPKLKDEINKLKMH